VGIAVAFLSFGVHGALVANGVSALITAVLVLRHLRRQFELRWTPPPTEIIGKLVGYGARYYIGALGVMAGAHIGTMVLASVSTSNEVGLFGAAAALIMQLTLLPDALATVIHPRIADDPAGRPDLTAMCGRIVGILCGAMYLAIALFASPIATLIFGGEFQQVADPLRILALGGWIRSVARVFVPFLNATNRPGIGAWATAAGVAVNLALIGPWYRTHGLIGAAWAVTIAYILHAGIVSWAFCRFARMGVASAFLPRRQDVFAMAEAVRRIRRGNES
jgi:O-antigen/teichoic acid export membrane protein